MHDLLNLEQQTYQIPNFVHDLWLPDIKQWDATKISTLFGQQDATVILQVPIITAQGQDMLCWTPTSSGTCTSKSAYKQLAVQQRGATIPTHIPHQVLELLRKVWDDKLVQPRLKTFAWRLLLSCGASHTRAGDAPGTFGARHSGLQSVRRPRKVQAGSLVAKLGNRISW
jgi:hypothetical protein